MRDVESNDDYESVQENADGNNNQLLDLAALDQAVEMAAAAENYDE